MANRRFIRIDLTGQRFGKLIVMHLSDRKSPKVYWICKCDCGTVKEVQSHKLRSQRTFSCGCDRGRLISVKRARHGCSRVGKKTPEYGSWARMTMRCRDPHGDSFKHYGGRGITVCQRWRESFAAFLADMGPKPTPRHSIERINNNGNYEPGNCRWATQTEQMRNTRTNAFLTFAGITATIAEWAERTGIHVRALYSRRQRKEPVASMLTRGASQEFLASLPAVSS